jgi:hypothetical protein
MKMGGIALVIGYVLQFGGIVAAVAGWIWLRRRGAQAPLRFIRSLPAPDRSEIIGAIRYGNPPEDENVRQNALEYARLVIAAARQEYIYLALLAVLEGEAIIGHSQTLAIIGVAVLLVFGLAWTSTNKLKAAARRFLEICGPWHLEG